MRNRHILIEVRRLPSGGWRVWKLYPKVKGSKCSGWVKNDGHDLEKLIPFALEGVKNELLRRARARGLPAKPISAAAP